MFDRVLNTSPRNLDCFVMLIQTQCPTEKFNATARSDDATPELAPKNVGLSYYILLFKMLVYITLYSY